MADPLHVLLGRCCVSIQRNGTGFFVSPTQILTCAHVLDSRMPPSLPVGAEVDVMASDGTVRKARLARLLPEQDLALLTLDGAGGPAVILGEPDAELVEEERLLVLGFPAFDRSSRELASLSVRYDGSSDSTTRKRLQFKGNNVVGGFSGGPLLSLHTGRVVGMVTESREKRSTIGGWAIPTETIRELPDLGAAAGTDLAAWAQALEDRQGFIDLSSPGVQPVLRRLTESGSSALDFAARRIGFVGREAEMEGLKDFLDHPAPFAWMLMSGPSGAGKSRLALELCLAAHPVWRAGFVDKEQLTDLRFWRQWRPNRPTLLVLDDAGTRGETSGNLARCLGAKQYRPRFQIRLLLIEREASALPGAVSLRDGGWFESFLGAGTIERNAVFGARYPGRDGPDLAVGPLRDADLGQILAAAVPADTSEDHRDAVLKRLPSFDPERRALFAIILADSSTGVKDRIEAVREILENDRQSRWQPAGYTEDDAALLAISTILDGVARDRLRGHAEWLDRAVAQFKASRFRRLTGQDEASRLGYLKPNIVGELFVLDQLQARSEEEARRLVGAAWAIDAVAAAGFMIRTVFDYPEQLELRRLIGAPAGPEDAARHWASAIVDITRNMPPRHVALGEWLLAEGGRAALVRPNDAEIFDLLARLTFNIWQLYGRADRPDAAKACRGKLDALVAKHPDRTRARKLEARMLMSDLMSDLVAIAVADEQAMARPLGPAPYTFQPSITRFAEAQRIFDRMVASLPRGKPDDELADLFAAGAFHLVLGYARPAITIRRFWMPAALILEGDVEIQLAKAQAIYPKLRRVAKPTPPGSDARHWLAQAAAVLSAAYVERKQIEAVAKLRDEIEAMSSSPEDARVREELSRIGFNLVLGLSREGNATAVAEAMAWLDKFADTHPEQAFIQERRQRARKALEA